MCGIEDCVYFDCVFDCYVLISDGRVEVCFWFGGFVLICDVLVGVDGVNFWVCFQLVLNVQLVDIGVVCIYGKVDLDWLGGNYLCFEGIIIVFVDRFVVIFDQMQFDWYFLEYVCVYFSCSVMFIFDYFYWCLIGCVDCFGVVLDY